MVMRTNIKAPPAALPADFEDCIGIFQGGGCRAAAYAGAYSAAVTRHVNFSEVAGASAGSIAAVLVAAGASPEWLEESLSSLDFGGLLQKPAGARFAMSGSRNVGKAWNLMRFNGIYNSQGIETWVEERLRELLPRVQNKKVLFRDLPKPAAVIAADLVLQGPKVWSQQRTPDDSVSEAVRASCSIPFFFQPFGPFVDGGVVSNLPTHIVENGLSDRRRILAFTLNDNDSGGRPGDMISTAQALASTVTRGGQEVQSSLQSDIDVISIWCDDIKSTDFHRMNSAVITKLVEAGRTAVNEFFDAGVTAINPVQPSQVSTHRAQTLATIAEQLLKARTRVLISSRDTNWVFDLYSALLILRYRGVSVVVSVPPERPKGARAQQQIETLEALGCSLKYVPTGPRGFLQAFVCDPGEATAAAIVFSKPELAIHARLLTSVDGDEDMIDLIAQELDYQSPQEDNSRYPLSITEASDESVRDALEGVPQYANGAAIELRSVDVEFIDSWARYALLYKQTQQRVMLQILRENDIDEFSPYFVRYGNGKQSLALPIVVEESPNGRCTVVNGLSRLLLLKREGRTRILCAVVSGVTDPPPAKGTVSLSNIGVRVGLRDLTLDRYRGFVYQNVRKVESDANRLQPITD